MFASADGVFGLYNNAFNDFGRLQFGGTTSSFPSLKRSTTSLVARLADDSSDTEFKARHFIGGGTAPTITAAFGTSPSIAGTDFAGRVTVGTGGTATTGTITFGTAFATAPSCHANNETTLLFAQATATTTTLVITSATPFGAADKITYICGGY
jgi:hypothetical protein